MVSGDRNCNLDSVLTICKPSSLSSCNDLSLDFNTSSTTNSLHACVNSPCISCRNDLNKSHDDMIVFSCCHDKNASISSSACVANHVEETEDSMGQDKVLNEATNAISSSPSSGTHLCLMARDSKITPTLEPITSCDEEDVDNVEEELDIDDLYEKGEIVYRAVVKNNIACSNFVEILDFAIKSKEHIDKLEAQIEEQENIIDEKFALEREYANEIAQLKDSLEEEQTTKESLEETFTLELSRVKEYHDRELAVANSYKIKNDELDVAYAKLVEDFKHLENGSRVVKRELIKLTESHEQLKASYLKELNKLPSPLANNNDACATNSISCEASTLKENVELKAQLALLTSNYGKLEESHDKLSSSHEDLLVSHGRLKLAHEVIVSKVTSSGPHVDISTISTSNLILPCASPCSSSSHNHDISRDELHSVPCCSNNVASTSSSTFVETNHVEEIKELKAQVTSLKNDLKKGHQGKAALNKILSMQKSPNDKSGLGFNSNVKKKSTIKLKHKGNKKNGQVQVKNLANIVCFKCKEEGHHVKLCPLKKKSLGKKQQGKRPQALHLVRDGPPPKKTQDLPQVVASSKNKDGKSRTCYICRKKGHISSSCTMGISSSNPIIIDNVYSLYKDE